MKTEDTGGLPYELILVLNRPYMITTNIDVADGLSNGTVGKLINIESDGNNDILRLWFKFPKSVGKKRSTKVRNDIVRQNIDKDAVPIYTRTSSIPLNNNKTIVAKRKHFPVISALAMTIHKAQGGTFDDIVYEYNRSHTRELVYVALSRVTNIEGLFLVTTRDTKESWKFWTGRVGVSLDDSNATSATTKNQKRATTHQLDLSMELKRLQTNNLQTITNTFLEFISKNKNNLSIFSFNCQSLRAHAADLELDAIVKKIDVLILSETHMKNEEVIDIPNFNFVVSFKRPDRAAGGVAIYNNAKNSVSRMCTSHMDVHTRFSSMLTTNVSEIGDICVCRYQSKNGQFIIVVAIYISPGKSIRAIQEFLYENLMIYSKDGSALLEKKIGKRFDNLPMILSGDFNINFADDKNLSLIEFLNQEFQLAMSNDRQKSTTRCKTTLDGVFTKYLHNFESKNFVSYFSYHRPIISILEFDNNDNDNND